MRFLLFMGLLASFTSMAGAADCSAADKRFVYEQLLSADFEEAKTNRTFKIRPEQVCAVANKEASDSRGYYLYKIGPWTRYISVHNGLNGHVQMYGPFKF
ncbi:hypothetical protein [Pseudoalteromonas rubra]|uniref:Uncharacterized protein n=1 Tax=Pseudoalteromonas rubra TaxID=43658 RepID=A0A5S3X5H3_9GAMM|nr:hypothetical protein [Pseudoalteromonas rubra]TMP39294.1 hypothetical protein CWB98_01520 [Pseudoalteromonas rubra]